MKTCIIALLCGVAIAAGTELENLRAQFEIRHQAALRPVRQWYGEELKRLEDSLIKARKVEAAAEVRRERLAMLITSVNWTWHKAAEGKEHTITFNADGTGRHTNTDFTWRPTGDNSIEMTLPSKRKCTLTFDPIALTYSGAEFDGKTPVRGKAKL